MDDEVPRSGLRRVVLLPTIASDNDPQNVEDALTVVRPTLARAGIELVEVEDDCLAEDEAACLALLETHNADAILIVTAYRQSGELRPTPVLVIDLFSARAHVSRSRTFVSIPSAVTSSVMNRCLSEWAGAQPVSWTIAGTPAGAAVQVDQEMGALPFTTNIQPGEHQLVVRAPGYATLRETVSVEAGQESYRTEVALEPGEDDETATPGGGDGVHWQRIAGPVMLGVGAAGAVALVAGTLARTGTENITEGRRERDVAVGPLVGLTGVAVAVAAVGVVLWLTAPESRTQVALGADRVTLVQSF